MKPTTRTSKLLLERWLGIRLGAMPSEAANTIVEQFAPAWEKKSDSWTDNMDYVIITRAHACRKALSQYTISDVVIPYTSRFELKMNKGNFDREKMIKNLILIVDRTCPICGMSEKKWFETEPRFHWLFQPSQMLSSCCNCGTGGLVDVNDI